MPSFLQYIFIGEDIMNNDKLRRIYRAVMLIIVVALITFVLTSVFLYNKLGTSSILNTGISGVSSELLRKIYSVKSILDNKYVSEINEEELINAAIKGYVSGVGDEYTQYFTKEEMEDFYSEIEGNYVGIGIYMVQNNEDNTIVVLYPIEGSPAQAAGIQTGDIIKKVDGVEVTGEDFEEISSKIKGKEGTKVTLEIERNGQILTFEIERKSIDLYPIESELLENNIGYINITSFDSDCAKEFKTIYENLAKTNITSLIIDLRNNGGGIVSEALEIADYVLEKNQIMLITKDKEGKERVEKSSKKPIINVPIVILTNQATASASEILAAALRENNKAVIVGEKTYGKGVIQELYTLSDGSGLKVTVEEYYTPNRNKINGIGITPDKEVAAATEVIVEMEQDVQLQEAIKILKDKK